MDELIRQLEELTDRFMNDLDKADYLAVEHFIDQRDGMIARIREFELAQPVLDRHKTALTRILQHDAAIIKKMNLLRDEASSNMKNFQQAITQRNAYDAKYADESLFFDKRR